MPRALGGPLPYQYRNLTIGLILANVAVFMLTMAFPRSQTLASMGLAPFQLFDRGAFWQPLTYMFLHADMWHIVFNMLALYLFGSAVERHMGSYEFLVFYLVAGVGAGLFTAITSRLSGDPGIFRVIGASGAVFALLLAYATLFPDSTIFLWFIPMRAPIAVLVFGGIAVVSQLTSRGGQISHMTHIGGLVVGFLYLFFRMGVNPLKVFFSRR